MKILPKSLTVVLVSVFILGVGRTASAQGTGVTTRVSVASDGTQGNAGSGFWSSVSYDGRYVAFQSDASNLVAGDTNGARDVFLHDRQTGQTTRVSVASDGTQGNDYSFGPSISADGRYVAFTSDASNLVAGDTNGREDAFVHDRQTGQTTRVSVHSNGTRGNSDSYNVSISGDGRYVVFSSWADNLIGSDLNGDGLCDTGCDTNWNVDLFVHDCQTGQTIRIVEELGHGYISSDGRYIAFRSTKSLVPEDTKALEDIYVYDRQTGQTTLVSVASDGTQGNSGSYNPSISADGRFVTFCSADNLAPGTSSWIAIYVHDRQTGQTGRVSGPDANLDSFNPSISADGRHVAFSSKATNLVSNDTNGREDIFVHDRQTGQTTRVSVASDGTQGNLDSQYPSISGNGRYVAFASVATNVVPGDTNGVSDIFVHDRGGALNRTAGCKPCVSAAGEPIDTATGEFFTEPKIDIDLGGPIPLFFSRTYASRLYPEGEVQSSLGSNWMHNFDILLKKTSLPARKAIVVYGRGNIINFEQPAQQNEWFVQSSAQDTEETVYQLREGPNREYWFMDPNRNLVYRFYDAPSGLFGRLREIQDRNGNTLTFTYDASGNLTQVTDGLGRTLTFTYNASGNLTGLSDGTRNLIYIYTNGVLTGFTDAMGNTTTYIYQDPVGSLGPLLTAIQLPLGNQHHTQTYDAQGRVISQGDAYGNTLTLQYNTPSAGVTTITDALGRSRTNKHVRDRVITEATDATGKTSTITRDANDRPTQVTDRLQASASFEFHEGSGKLSVMTDTLGHKGRLHRIEQTQEFGPVSFTFYPLMGMAFPDGTFEAFTYDDRGNVTKRVDQGGYEWRYVYGADGALISETNPEGGVIERTYNQDGTLSSVKNTDTVATVFEYDAQKRLKRAIRPGGAVVGYEYDLNDRVIRQTDENGHVSVFTYDVNGNVVAVTDPLGHSRSITYNGMDRQVEMADRLGRISSIVYDANGRISSLWVGGELVARYRYDENGRMTGIEDASGRVWSTTHDPEGSPVAEWDPLGKEMEYEYDAVGHLRAIVNPEGARTRFTRDAMSRVLKTEGPREQTMEFAYDALGRVIGISQSSLGSVAITWNALGNPTALVDSRGGTWSFTYTPMGRLKTKDDPLGNTTMLAYDALGRITSVTHPDGVVESMQYDLGGNLIRTSSSDGTSSARTLDALDRLVTTERVAFQYDAESNIIGTTADGVRIETEYDAFNRPVKLVYPGGALVVTYSYNAVGLLERVADSRSGAWIEFSYDESQRLVEIRRANGVTTFYRWDDTGRLAGFDHGSLSNHSFSYDEAGNLSSIEHTGALEPTDYFSEGTFAFSYDAAQQLSSAGYQHDRRGRLTQLPSQTLTWDAADRVVGIDNATLEYNGMKDVVTLRRGAAVQAFYYNYAWQPAVLVAEGSGTPDGLTRYYVWSPTGSVLYLIDALSSAVRFYHFDHLGSTLFLTDASGSATDAYAYLPYGLLAGRKGSTGQPFTFLGEHGAVLAAEPGLYRFGARYYEATSARFVSRDPRWPRYEHLLGVNPYVYALDNPVNVIDPYGEIGSGWLGRFLKREFISRAGKEVLDRVTIESLKITGPKMIEQQAVLDNIEEAKKKLPREEFLRKEAESKLVSFVVKELDLIQNGPMWKDWKDALGDVIIPWYALPLVINHYKQEVARAVQVLEWAVAAKTPKDFLDKLDSDWGIMRRSVEGTVIWGKPAKYGNLDFKVAAEAYKAYMQAYLAIHEKDVDLLVCLMGTMGFKSVDEMYKFYVEQDMPIAKMYHHSIWEMAKKKWSERKK